MTSKYHYITGLHRAGTHQVADAVARENGAEVYYENRIRWDSLERRFIVEIVFDSDLGNNLPHNDEAVFAIKNLTKVA